MDKNIKYIKTKILNFMKIFFLYGGAGIFWSFMLFQFIPIANFELFHSMAWILLAVTIALPYSIFFFGSVFVIGFLFKKIIKLIKNENM